MIEPVHKNPDILPHGTITLLFTDIEGSTQLLHRLGDDYAALLVEHRALLRSAFKTNHGYEVDTQGDAFFVAFTRAVDAVAAAIEAQRAVMQHRWPEGATVRVRMALHTGEPTLTRNGEAAAYVGVDVHRCARIAAVAHGGQVLLSQTTRDLVHLHMPAEVTLRDLGEHHLKDLAAAEHLYQLVIRDLPADFSPLKTLGNQLCSLPPQVSPIIGREQEVAAALQLLRRSDVQLLTFTGTGGTGKTRLALQVASEVMEEFADGICFSALAPIRDAELVIPTIAQTLGIIEGQGRSIAESLYEFLHSRQMLLVLDNFEHIAAAAPRIAQLLRVCPQVKVLATSRVALHLSGEQEFLVPPLVLPDPKSQPSAETLSHNPSVELFMQRARAVKPDFVLSQENAAAVAQICARLDGLPLAIELAAARIKFLPPHTLLSRLDSRFRVLTGGAQDLPERHQKLSAAIDWSYDLLVPNEQALLRHLSVFVGGSTLEAAEAICNSVGSLNMDVIEGVMSLVDKSLLRQEERNGEARFFMLETIREYARERLAERAEEATARRQHALYFTELSETAEPELQGSQQGLWMRQLEAEHDNIRAALVWSLEHEPVIALRLAHALYEFWWRNFQREGREALESTLERATTAPKELRAKALRSLAHLTTDVPKARQLLTESRTLFEQCNQPQGYAWTLHDLGNLALAEQDLEQAKLLYETSATLFRQEGDKSGLGWALRDLSRIYQFRGDMEEAERLANESMSHFREAGNKTSIAISLGFLGEQAERQEDLTKARAYYEESLAVYREVDHRTGILVALRSLGPLAFQQGDIAQAKAYIREAVSLVRATDDKRAMTNQLQSLAESLLLTDPRQAHALLEECLTLRRQTDDQEGLIEVLFSLNDLAIVEGDTAQARSLNEKIFPLIDMIRDKDLRWSSFLRLGQSKVLMGDYDEAYGLYSECLTLARQLRPWPRLIVSHLALTRVDLLQEDLSTARSNYQDAVQIYRETAGKLQDNYLAYVLLLLGGYIAVAAGAYEQGGRLLGAAEAHQPNIPGPLFDAFWKSTFDGKVATLRAALGEETFAYTWTHGKSMTTEEAISYVLNSFTQNTDGIPP